MKKTIYGLVQSVKQFFVKPVEALKSYGLKGNQVTPCLWIKNKSSGIVLVSIYVDGYLAIVATEAINEVIESLKAHGFGLKVENGFTDNLRCKTVQENEKGRD